MVARVTLAEIDTVRMPVELAIERFDELVVPALRDQDGFEGFYLLTTREGKGMVLSFWRDEEAAEASLSSGHYAAQLEKFVTLFRAPPGREQYDVSLADGSAIALSYGLSR
jgi:heme-degrading monooxygenase HmoA